MDQRPGKRSTLFSPALLSFLLAVSVLTNIVFVVRLRYPAAGDWIRLAMVPPPAVAATDHMRGRRDAKTTIIEYADVQCPYCAKMHDVLRTAVKDADVRWIYRHFPLASHPLAGQAAEAAECAADQNRFWEYTDALFERRSGLSEDAFGLIARDLGLSTITFQLCLGTGSKRETVARARETGAKLKIQGTPTLFINGKRYTGFIPEQELRRALGLEAGPAK